MPWVRFDDQYPIHRKVAVLDDRGYRMHSESIFWCARNLTDGRIGKLELRSATSISRPSDVAAVLVRRGLYHQAGDECGSPQCPAGKVEIIDGYVVHDYWNYQPSKEKVLQDRARKAKAGQKGGFQSGKVRRSNAERSKREAKPKQSASRLVEPPYLLPSKEGERGRGGAAKAPPAPPATAHPFTDDGSGTCATCELPKHNRNHLHAVEDSG